MNCKECRDLVERYIDGALRGFAKRKVSLHLSRCTACREYFDARRQGHAKAYRAMNAALSGERLSPGFAQRFRAAHVVPERRLWPFGRNRWKVASMIALLLGGMAVAATVAVVELRGTSAPGVANEPERGATPVGRDTSDAPDQAGYIVPGAESIPETISHDSSIIHHSEEIPMNSQSTASAATRSAAKAMTAAALALGAPAMAQANVETTNLVDVVEIAADTNITVAANEVLKIEYVYGDNPVTVTKSGGGRLEIATSSITNLSVVISEGTFASARPAAIPLNDTFRPSLRLDASDASKFTISQSNGTNFLTKVMDADGNGAYFSRWSGWGYPYVAAEKLNGLGLIDFGTMKDKNSSNSPAMASGNGGMFAFNNIGPDGASSMPLGDFFFVWKDRDDSIDHELFDGKEFTGPNLLGNNPGWFVRGDGGGGNGFTFYTVGMHGAIKDHIHLDGQKVNYDKRVPRGFHLLRNRVKEGYSVNVGMIGYTSGSSAAGRMWTAGGFVLAEAVIYSNRLAEATARRVEAQLQSKWLGLKLKNLTLGNGATLDVGAFKFAVGTLDVSGSANVVGATNLCFDALTRGSGSIAAAGGLEISGDRQPLVPDIGFSGDALFDVTGTSRVQTVVSGTGRLVKSGEGELNVADPVTADIAVESGTLSVSPLCVRSAEYHLDANEAATLDWTETDGRRLVSAWHDTEEPSRAFKATTWRKYNWNSSLLVRAPYIAENATGGLAMLDFGTYANCIHTDGWGGSLEGSTQFSEGNGVQDIFAVWMDDPDVKNYPIAGDGKEFVGPCIFGMQYYWNRGIGGNGNAFPVHSSSNPGRMYSPLNTGLVYVDGKEVAGHSARIGDGVHVLAQRVVASGGTPLQQIGGNNQAGVVNMDGTKVQGVYGGLRVGEVLIFKNCLPDRLRFRISGALCSKWRGDTNEWDYASISIAAGATLNHPFADLAVADLVLGGTLAAKSVRPKSLTVAAAGAVLDGSLELEDNGQVTIVVNPNGTFGTVRASRVKVSGSGCIAFRGDISSLLCGQSFRIVAAESVEAPGMSWKAPSLRGTGLRAVLSAKADGLYLTFASGGFIISFK